MKKLALATVLVALASHPALAAGWSRMTRKYRVANFVHTEHKACTQVHVSLEAKHAHPLSLDLRNRTSGNACRFLRSDNT